MSNYLELSKIYHKAGNDGDAELEAAYQARFNAESTFRTGLITSGHELFLTMPHELSLLTERILRKERRVSNMLRRLPAIAHASFVRDLIMDEVVYSNEIEGIHSTRKQIGEVLESIQRNDQSPELRRFREFARLYLQLSDESHKEPASPEDIREIYDLIMDGELSEDEIPDGKIFRKDSVEIIGSGKSVHTGVNPESAIIEYVDKLLDLMRSDAMPGLYSAAIFHYAFEYIHPFYDGNGRTGRYLLALHLSKVLSISTALSLSRTIAEDKGAYYRGFRSVENRLNKSDATPFVIMILEFIDRAQDDMLDRLDGSIKDFERATNALNEYRLAHPELEEKECAVLYLMLQVKLFGAFSNVSIHEVADYLDCSAQTARKYTQSLEDKSLIEARSRRPLSFELTEGAEGLLLE